MVRVRGKNVKVETQPNISVNVTVTNVNEEQQTAAITAVETVVTFTTLMNSVLVYNDGPNDIYYSNATGVDTTNFKIPALSAATLDAKKTLLYFICAAGQTATVYCYGVY